MIKAVIFDMDGLLIDSEPLWQESEIEIFQQVDISLNSQLCLETMGLRIDGVVDYWYQKFPWQQPSKQQMAEKIVLRVIELIEQKGVAKAGVHYALNFFRQQNLKIALASSSHRRIIDVVLRKLGIREQFESICSGEEQEYGKPHPAIYLATAEKLKVLPQECLVLEDSLNGVLAAKAAQMKCIAIPETIADYNPKLIIADLILESLLRIKTDICCQISG